MISFIKEEFLLKVLSLVVKEKNNPEKSRMIDRYRDVIFIFKEVVAS